MKLMILGYARHGKDTAGEYLAKTYNLHHVSSSLFAAERVVYPILKDKYGYSTLEECYEDRSNHRKEWFDLICEYNEPDRARLPRELYQDYDIYIGLRNAKELAAIKKEGIIDSVLWIDAEDRLGTKEDISSCTVEPSDANWIVNNNRSLEYLFQQLDLIYNRIIAVSSGGPMLLG